MFFSRLINLKNDGMNILFPRRCALCGDKQIPISEHFLCRDCTTEICFVQQPVCRICGTELLGHKENQYLCGECLIKPPPYLLARSAIRYNAIVKNIMHRLKYRADTSVVPGISEILSGYDMTLFDSCDCVIPVPLHKKRLRARGLNQSMVLAKCICRKNKQLTMVPNLLVRSKNTVPQTTLDGIMRRKNLKGAFNLARGANIEGISVCLVDDVFTTGTTVSECSKVLCSNGAKEVRVFTLARVVVSQRGRRAGGQKK